MTLTFNITVYHGTKKEYVDDILKNGFDPESASCATQDKEWASLYGDTLISFKFPYYLHFSFKSLGSDFWYLRRFLLDYYFGKTLVFVYGYKPKNIKTMPSLIS